MSQYTNLDSAETMFFQRELEQVKAKSYDVLKAPLKAFELIPVDSTTAPGAKTVTYEQYDSTGIAKIISNYAEDLPTADVKGKEFTSMIKSIGNSYVYSKDDIRAAQFAGKPLNQQKANAAVEAHRQLMNKLAFKGDSEYGIQGLLTNANIPSAPVVAGAATTLTWVTKTPDEILKDLNSAVSDMLDLTKGVEVPNTIVMPIAQYNHIATTARSANSDTTILEFFKGNNPGIEVMWATELKGAFTGGTDGFIVYKRDPMKLWMEIPMMVEMSPAQEKGLSYVVPCESKFGGVITPYPLSLSFRYGI